MPRLAIQLLRQVAVCPTESLLTRLHFLGKPVPARGSLQSMCDFLGVSQKITLIFPYKLSGWAEPRGTVLFMPRVNRGLLTHTAVILYP